jgi:hypothetical protein
MNNLKELIDTKFNELFGDPWKPIKDVAIYFSDNGITGYKDQLDSCPVANWLITLSKDISKVEVHCPTEIDIWDRSDNHYKIYHTDKSKEFIRAFDKGEFPTLDKDIYG